MNIVGGGDNIHSNTGNLLCSCGGFVRVCRGVRIVLCQYYYLFKQRSFIKWVADLVMKMVPDPKSIVKQGRV